MTYSEKLSHPKWQRRRLQIMERDNFTCQICNDTEETLNVHHKVYKRGEIWEYKDDELITYCKVCHAVVEYFKSNESLSEVITIKKFKSLDDFGRLNVFVVSNLFHELSISILLYYSKSKELVFHTSIKEDTVSMMFSLINEYSIIENNG